MLDARDGTSRSSCSATRTTLRSTTSRSPTSAPCSPTEDRGDRLHDQLNALDSVWAFDICNEGAPAKRLLASGQDASVAKTDEDNEPTGLHISDGEPSVRRLLGSSSTNMSNMSRWRWFFTQQHGDNTVYEIVKSR